MCDQDLMDKLRKLLEIGSNVAIIVVAVVLGVYLIGRYFSPPSVPASGATAGRGDKAGSKTPVGKCRLEWERPKSADGSIDRVSFLFREYAVL